MSAKPLKSAIVCFVVVAAIHGVEKSSIAAEERPATNPEFNFTVNTLLAQSPPTRGDSVLCELGGLSGFSVRRLTSCDSAEIIEYPRDSGRRAARFEIKPNDPRISSGWRAELRDLKESVNGEETWYRISTLVPRSFPIAARHAVVLSQWHERVKKGHAGYRPPLSHRLIDGEFFVFLWNTKIQKEKNGEGRGKVLYREPGFALGKFHEFVYRIVWLPDNTGIVQGWKRVCGILDCDRGEWRKIINYKGAVGYHDAVGYYFKAGLYTVHPFEKPMVAYHARYSTGPDPVSVGAIEPLFRK